MCFKEPLQIKQKYLTINLEDHLQINAFLDWWWWSKKNKLTLYQEARKRSYKEAVWERPAGYGSLDSWDVNISFNLGQSQSSSSIVNAKVEVLDMTLNDLAGFADGF